MWCKSGLVSVAEDPWKVAQFWHKKFLICYLFTISIISYFNNLQLFDYIRYLINNTRLYSRHNRNTIDNNQYIFPWVKLFVSWLLYCYYLILFNLDHYFSITFYIVFWGNQRTIAKIEVKIWDDWEWEGEREDKYLRMRIGIDMTMAEKEAWRSERFWEEM